MKKTKSVLLAIFGLSLVICGCSKTAAQKDYILATGGTSGTYYPFGGPCGIPCCSTSSLV